MAEIAVVFILGTTAVMASVVVSSYKESANKTRLDHYMTHYTLPADAAAAAAQQRQQQQLLQQHHHDHAADDTDDDEDDATAATESSSNLCDLKAQQLLSPAPAHGSDAPLSAAAAAAPAARRHRGGPRRRPPLRQWARVVRGRVHLRHLPRQHRVAAAGRGSGGSGGGDAGGDGASAAAA
eukprot:TRINITY_DN8652_c1_g1_i1.p5 TRINITY_DN8652_c1_g1~~TRINITY_DN8652_c1_g1_i1.p5  ORF type:complete len:181 (-),score=91.99 TRINITY_DN8652_c1_g1_i1:979-1521(-)